MYYFEILEGLFKQKIRYLIIGGLGVNLYGVPRTTQDIDLIISMDRDNVLRLVAMLKGLGYRPRLPVAPESLADPVQVRDWIDHRNMKAFSFIHGESAYKVLDVVLVHPLDFEKAFQRRTVKAVQGVDVNLASIDDLIEAKKFSGRPQDLSDIVLLHKAKRYQEEGK
jgi:hypothetical protein